MEQVKNQGLNKWEKRLKKNEKQNLISCHDLEDFLNLQDWRKHGQKNQYNDLGIYVLLNPLTKWHKIGVSDNPVRRCEAIGTSSGFKLTLAFAITPMIGDYNPAWLEENIHKYFAKKRIHGEWFDLNYEDLDDLYYVLIQIDEAGMLFPDEPDGYYEDNSEQSYLAIDPERYNATINDLELSN